MGHNLKNKSFADFFAGIGLMQMGLEKAGWNVEFSNDWDENKHAMHSSHFKENSHYKVQDIEKLDTREIPDVTLATACFPCTDLSLAGLRDGLDGKSSSAFLSFIKKIEAKKKAQRPPLILLENVYGFLSSHSGKDFKKALSLLNELGYAVDTFILDAKAFVPQSRKRLFVLAVSDRYAKGLNQYDSVGKIPVNQNRPQALLNFIKKNQDIKWCTRRLPKIKPNDMVLEDIVEAISLDSELWWSTEHVKRLITQMAPIHLAKVKGMKKGESWSYATVYRRIRNGTTNAEVRNDGIAGCLRTPRGGSSKQILIQAGKGELHVRFLTPREYARLMGAGDYIIPESKSPTQALFGFGDAVCVPAIEWIGKKYINPLLKEILN